MTALKLALITAIFCTLAFAAGYYSAGSLPECGMIDTQPGAYCYGVEPARDCTTDSDCVEKYGE